LIELLVADLIAGFVITAAIAMLIIAFNSANRVTDRVSAAQTGRVAMEQIQQRMRSQTCLFPLEYNVNGGTTIGAQASIVHADNNEIVFFGDVGATGGAAGVTGSVGFEPQLRYIYLANDATGRRGTLVEGWRSATTTTAPYNYNISPATSLDSLAASSTMASVTPTTKRAIADGVGNMVAETAPTGATGPTVPLFRYYDANDALMTMDATLGALPTASLDNVSRITVGFKVFGLTGKDQAGPTNPLDIRYATFRDDIYLRTIVNRCQ
jgi:type II secretory pathway pseudopilin PulG